MSTTTSATATTTGPITTGPITTGSDTPGAPAGGHLDAATAVAWAGEHQAVVVDVRSPGEFAGTHIAGSTNIPLDLLLAHPEQTATALAGTGAPVLLVCQSGARSTQALERLSGLGLAGVHALDGGVPAYAAAGGQVESGRGRWAMDRQVRLAAGSLVTTSVLASLALPRARFLAGAVGAGLTWSAVSNTCAMARALGALPYNRGPQAPELEDALAQLGTTPQASTPGAKTQGTRTQGVSTQVPGS
ncbi:rhodanese-like domain-containing protein [uncultured Pseudokineococcus sp.]|uniref:rhodanese-like domain-containing protein n=1 Tax=uncultured Pseudokineococcus sp. TaxID=1642928 RepID=UPI0026379B55|nr:rhodanese-like domain-containing protein [uncultured Pseudokineococcus sp.]